MIDTIDIFTTHSRSIKQLQNLHFFKKKNLYISTKICVFLITTKFCLISTWHKHIDLCYLKKKKKKQKLVVGMSTE